MHRYLTAPRTMLQRHLGRWRQRGVTLIELVIAIAIIGVAVAGVLGVFTVAARYNADPVIRKQALAIAEALMDEILSRPYTSCDPDSYDPTTQTCTLNGSVAEANGPEAGETRTGASRFDNVNDYDGYSRPAGVAGDGNAATGIEDVLGNTPDNWKPYSVTVTVTPSTAGFGPAGQQVPAGQALFVQVSVTGPGPTTINLNGVRTRYDPTP
jgi:MSHA pilin protein MshD